MIITYTQVVMVNKKLPVVILITCSVAQLNTVSLICVGRHCVLEVHL